MARKKTDTLKLDPRNARKHPQRNQDMIKKSLEEVGGFRSIAVDGQNIIRAGNGVYEQAKALGLKVRIVDAKPNEIIAVRRNDLKGKKAIRAALLDNRAGEISEWDADTLSDIMNTEKELLDSLFNDDELKELGLIVPNFEPASIDEQGRLDQKKPVTCPECGHEFVPK